MLGLLPTIATGPNLNSKEELLKAGVWVGKLPSTGIIHQLTLDTKGSITIERKPYVSLSLDGWTQSYQPLTEKAENHIYLISQIRKHSCQWQE
jgi:hypothetical protein